MNATCRLVKTLRLERAWSQEHLAALTSLSVRTIQRIENGEKASLETLGALAAAFGINVAQLVAQAQTAETDTVPEPQLPDPETETPARLKNHLYRRAGTYLKINLLLCVINLLTTPQRLWFIWPLGIWGGILLLRAGKVYWLLHNTRQG